MSVLSDEELVLQCRGGNTEAEEILLKRYTVVVKREVRYLFLVGAETEDLMQEAMIGLVKAIREYAPGNGVSFHTYATSCIRNQIRSAIRSANRMKHQPLNEYMSIYPDTDGAEEAIMITDDSADPEKRVLEQEGLRELEDKISKLLSSMERTVALLYLRGMSHSEIAGILGKPERSVNNALTRARNKLRQSIE